MATVNFDVQFAENTHTVQFEETSMELDAQFEPNGGGGGGAVNSVNGKTGTVVLDAGDLEYDDEETYTSGTVGKAISDLKGDLTGMNTATSSDVGKALKAKTVTNGKVTEWEFGEAGGSGLTADIKQALLQIASKVAYIDEHGQDYYDALEEALYPPADLVSISAVYTQSGTVYDTDTLDDLKTDLVVTALYEDQTMETVTSYTLSGTLTVGTSTITVNYGGKSATFTVTVTHEVATVKYYFEDLSYEDGKIIRPNKSTYSTSSGGYVIIPFVNGMKVVTVTQSSWVTNYPAIMTDDGSKYSNANATQGSEITAGIYYYEKTFGTEQIANVVVNFRKENISECYYEVTE